MGLLEGCFGLLTNYLFLWVCLRDVSDSLPIIHSFILWILRRQLLFLFKFYYMAVIATFILLLCDQAIINYLIEQFDAYHLLHEYNFLLHNFLKVFISYGRKSNGELLLSYGFVPQEGTNPHDSVELSLSLRKSDKCYKEKLETLKKCGLSAWVPIIGWFHSFINDSLLITMLGGYFFNDFENRIAA